MSTKKYFGTDGIRGEVGNSPITPDFMLKLGWAVGKVLIKDGHGQVLIGKDTRLSGYLFESALEAGIVSSGVDVMQLGPMPTPGIAYLTRSMHAQAGIVISASHNPYYDNGTKFFCSEGYKLPEQIELAIETMIDKPLEMVTGAEIGRALRLDDAPARYIEFTKNTFPTDLDLRGIKVVVDCAHGAMYHIAPKVLKELGAEVISIGINPDGLNINQGVGSTKPEALQKEVLKHKAEIGIAFDGDGDRVILVDEQGQVVDGDEILYVLSQSYHRLGLLTGGVVGTQMSNMGLEIALKQKGIPFKRSKVGDRHVMESLKAEGWNLGGESSGHIICLDKTTTGDGLIAALNVLAEMVLTQSSLATLKSGMSKLSQTLINVKVANGSKWIADPKIQLLLKQKEAELKESGRILLRPSGTEPVIRVMVEAEDNAKTLVIAQEIAQSVSQISNSQVPQ